MKPHLSFVMAGRNDDFGKNFLKRLQASANSILFLSEKYKTRTELILVEWNPPADRPRLKDAISWPKNLKYAETRIIEVPPEIHNQFKRSENVAIEMHQDSKVKTPIKQIPFFEFYAKNTGIRRAKGDYIVVTNSDIIFGEELIKYFSTHKFFPNMFARVDRYDVKGEIPLDESIENQLRFAKNHIFQIQTMHGRVFTSRAERFNAVILGKIKRLTLKKIKNRIQNFIKKPEPARDGLNFSNAFRSLYIASGGDFMLMHKKWWRKLRAYPELGIDRGLDCYMTLLAHTAGLLQVVMPFPIYHQEHDRAEQLFRPAIIFDKLPALQEMIKTEKPVITNSENWGLSKFKLQETTIKRS